MIAILLGNEQFPCYIEYQQQSIDIEHLYMSWYNKLSLENGLQALYIKNKSEVACGDYSCSDVIYENQQELLTPTREQKGSESSVSSPQPTSSPTVSSESSTPQTPSHSTENAMLNKTFSPLVAYHILLTSASVSFFVYILYIFRQHVVWIYRNI